MPIWEGLKHRTEKGFIMMEDVLSLAERVKTEDGGKKGPTGSFMGMSVFHRLAQKAGFAQSKIGGNDHMRIFHRPFASLLLASALAGPGPDDRLRSPRKHGLRGS
jgi:hypothetical protein